MRAYADFRSADPEGAPNLTGTDLSYSNLIDADLRGKQTAPTPTSPAAKTAARTIPVGSRDRPPRHAT